MSITNVNLTYEYIIQQKEVKEEIFEDSDFQGGVRNSNVWTKNDKEQRTHEWGISSYTQFLDTRIRGNREGGRENPRYSKSESISKHAAQYLQFIPPK